MTKPKPKDTDTTKAPDDDAGGIRLVTSVDRQLPEFEGKMPVGVLTSITGSGQRIGRAIHHDDRVVLLVEASVADIGHPMTKDGLKRRQTLHVEDLYEVEGAYGQRLLATCRQSWAEADRGGTILGEVPLPDIGRLGPKLDGSGVALTPAELADLGLDNPALDPVVVVWSDGTRESWPADFDEDLRLERPVAGTYAESVDRDAPTWDPPYIAEVLDSRTGEALSTWSAEDEDARLKALEDEEAAKEAEAMPVPGYGDMSATAALKAIAGADADTLLAIATYESEHKARKTIHTAVERRTAVLLDEVKSGLTGTPALEVLEGGKA